MARPPEASPDSETLELVHPVYLDTPMMVSFVAIGLNYGLNSWFIGLGYGHSGLAMSTGIVALSNFCLLYWFMRREVARLETKKLFIALAKIFLASDALALVCWGAKWLLLERWQTMGLMMRMSALGLTITVSLAAFCAVASMLGLREMRDLLDAVRRKLSRRATRAGSSGEEARNDKIILFFITDGRHVGLTYRDRVSIGIDECHVFIHLSVPFLLQSLVDSIPCRFYPLPIQYFSLVLLDHIV